MREIGRYPKFLMGWKIEEFLMFPKLSNEDDLFLSLIYLATKNLDSNYHF